MLYSTVGATWLAFGNGSRMDLHSVWIMPHTKQVQYMEAQDYYIFLTSVAKFGYRYFWLYLSNLHELSP